MRGLWTYSENPNCNLGQDEILFALGHIFVPP